MVFVGVKFEVIQSCLHYENINPFAPGFDPI